MSGDPECCVSGASITAPPVRGEDPELVGRLTVATRIVRHFRLSSATAEPRKLATLENGEG